MRISDWSSDVCSSDLMQACLDTVIPYLRERKQFGKPIGSFQLMQAKVADMYVALQSARAYTYAVAKACDAGQIGRASCRERVCPYVSISRVAVSLKKKTIIIHALTILITHHNN